MRDLDVRGLQKRIMPVLGEQRILPISAQQRGPVPGAPYVNPDAPKPNPKGIFDDLMPPGVPRIPEGGNRWGTDEWWEFRRRLKKYADEQRQKRIDHYGYDPQEFLRLKRQQSGGRYG